MLHTILVSLYVAAIIIAAVNFISICVRWVIDKVTTWFDAWFDELVRRDGWIIALLLTLFLTLAIAGIIVAIITPIFYILIGALVGTLFALPVYFGATWPQIILYGIALGLLYYVGTLVYGRIRAA